MSEIKTNKISPRKGTTQTIGDSGDSVSTSSGSTITNAGTITTAGITGGTINNTTGSIYLRGEVDWKPGDIKTASFTATDNQGFFVNTTSGEITVTLPASPSAGDVVGIKDYANTFDTNKCILNANGNKIQGSTTNFEITVEGSSIILIYVDSTRGWVITDASKAADISQQQLFITATGGTITESGDFKIHTFTGPGTFCVSQIGNPVGGGSNVDYRVVAGGGGGGTTTIGGGSYYAGGGGAGGHRTTFPSPGCNAGAFPITVQGYPITVGGAGTAGSPSGSIGGNGSNSVFSTITSAGGGGGSRGGNGPCVSGNGANGGSGGGATFANPGPTGAAGVAGTGNTPPTTPSQGNNGGTGGGTNGTTVGAGGGGGGAGGVGGNSPTPGPGTNGGAGGNGLANSITGSPVTLAGGGGGNGPGAAGAAGPGGGGKGGVGYGSCSSAGTINTGGGGGGFRDGGSGIVIIRYKFQ